MIPAAEVDAAALALLRTVEADTGLSVAPKPTTGSATANPYGVLEVAPAESHGDGGDLESPERHLVRRYRVRTVATSSSVEASTLLATHLAGLYKAEMLDRATPVAGDGWIVAGRRHVATSGVEVEGVLVNVVDEYEWVAVVGPEIPPEDPEDP